MTTVQIAIRDRKYASALRDLLMADGNHYVYVADRPSPGLQGLVVADDSSLDQLRRAPGFDFSRFIIFVRQLNFDADRLFTAGVRYVIHAEFPPEIGRLIVVAAEKHFIEDPAPCDAPERAAECFFDPVDQLFLQALRIDSR